MLPKSKYGTRFFDELFVKVISMPVVFARYVLSASVKLCDKAVLIGMIELSNGIKIPIVSA